MSLLYIIDAYNTINHNAFSPIRKKINPVRNTRILGVENKISNGVKDPQRALLEFIENQRLGKKSKSKITVVFDGYPKVSVQKLDEADINIVFSKEETADTRIKRMVEASKNPKNIVVVSDDREIKFFIKSIGASSIGVEEFINPAPVRRGGVNPEEKPQREKEDLIKPELNFSQISKINQELKALWLKK